MQKFSKYLPIGLFLAFFIFGLSALIESKPIDKNARVYSFVQQYSPYYLKKRFGGLEILKRNDPDFKEKPTNATLFREFERLERTWGEKHLKIKEQTLVVLDENGTQQAHLPLKTSEETTFVRHYYGVTP